MERLLPYITITLGALLVISSVASLVKAEETEYTVYGRSDITGLVDRTRPIKKVIEKRDRVEVYEPDENTGLFNPLPSYEVRVKRRREEPTLLRSSRGRDSILPDPFGSLSER